MESNHRHHKRIDLLDYLRGFALMGIILVNIGPLLEINEPAPADSLDFSYWRFLYLFVEGRFYTMFTFLFGVGFYIFLTRANAKGKNGYILFLRRMASLFVIGLVHVKFHPGEALALYAVCGLIILPFYKANKLMNLVFGTLMLIAFAIFSIKIFMVVPLMLLGIAAGQYRVFEKTKTKKIAVFTGVMLALSAAGLIVQAQYAPVQLGVATEATYLQEQHFISIGIAIGPIVSAFYAGLLLLLMQRRFFQKLFSPLKSYGRMALTNYVSQTILILLAGNAFDLFSQISYLQTLNLCVAIYVIQFMFSSVWLRYFRYGPLEWVWRIVTYWDIPPMRK
ncbi:DUF418 domain-containing protein [Neobacillus kokaensis]|uniref:Membrane protein n=1 Tax=Neobacillus kokaensis TaxID=2759023 RepID=A0ABQ3N9W2_9BACI|nr:DUF418 domain-containing protein [Neobacillus kokaensis]GHI00718.1 membrane protein [Neobacillus kokaensis]